MVIVAIGAKRLILLKAHRDMSSLTGFTHFSRLLLLCLTEYPHGLINWNISVAGVLEGGNRDLTLHISPCNLYVGLN